LVEEPENRLLELRYRGCRRDNPTAKPECDAETKAPAIGNRDKVLDLIDEPFAALPVAMQCEMDFLDVAPD
jgi:hypothetical protein